MSSPKPQSKPIPAVNLNAPLAYDASVEPVIEEPYPDRKNERILTTGVIVAGVVSSITLLFALYSIFLNRI